MGKKYPAILRAGHKQAAAQNKKAVGNLSGSIGSNKNQITIHEMNAIASLNAGRNNKQEHRLKW